MNDIIKIKELILSSLIKNKNILLLKYGVDLDTIPYTQLCNGNIKLGNNFILIFIILRPSFEGIHIEIYKNIENIDNFLELNFSIYNRAYDSNGEVYFYKYKNYSRFNILNENKFDGVFTKLLKAL